MNVYLLSWYQILYCENGCYREQSNEVYDIEMKSHYEIKTFTI